MDLVRGDDDDPVDEDEVRDLIFADLGYRIALLSEAVDYAVDGVKLECWIAHRGKATTSIAREGHLLTK